MKTTAVIYSIVFAVALSVGETLVLVKTNKYWPLSLDDYIVAGLLIGFALRCRATDAPWRYLLATWAFAVGNLYAILFSRLDPVHGSGERIPLMVVVTVAAVTGLVVTLRAAKLANETTGPDIPAGQSP